MVEASVPNRRIPIAAVAIDTVPGCPALSVRRRHLDQCI